MGDWLVSIAGTPYGAQLATALALMSALAHAVFGALQKSRYDPWITRGMIDGWIVIITAPIALFVVPWPDKQLAWLLAGAVILHFAYKCTIAAAYSRAAYTVVYPVVRGTGPLVTVIAASAIFGEHFTVTQWAGVGLLSGAILALALRNLSEEKLDRRALQIGLLWAVGGGIMVAAYTTYDAYSIRAAANPFTFLAWFFFLSSIDFAVLASWRQYKIPNALPLRPLVWRGFAGAVIALFSFGGVMLATRLDKVGEAAVLRETSVVFAALIGWFILGEKVGPRRAVLMALVALGAVIVETGA